MTVDVSRRSRESNGRFAREGKLKISSVLDRSAFPNYDVDSVLEEPTRGTPRGGYESWVVPKSPRISIDQPTYLTDGDCGFCRAAMDRAQKMFPGTFNSVPYWDAPLAELNLDMDKCYEAGHLVLPTEDGYRVMPGSLSWAGVLELQPNKFWRLCGVLMRRQPIKWIGDRAYRWIAHNRTHLGKQACKVPTRTTGNE